MTPKDGKTAYDAADLFGAETGFEDDFTLEEILSEFGGGLNNSLTREEPEEFVSEEETSAESRAEKAAPAKEAPPAPRSVTLEEVVGNTVSAVMEEQQAAVE